jgi:hypothetical protein
MIHIGDLSENMKVRASDGEELGTIIRLEGEHMLVEKGVSFLRDTLVPVSLVSHVRDGDVYLSATSEALRAGSETGGTGGVSGRTLREEAEAFVHEGGEIGVRTHAPDNLREGDAGPSER